MQVKVSKYRITGMEGGTVYVEMRSHPANAGQEVWQVCRDDQLMSQSGQWSLKWEVKEAGLYIFDHASDAIAILKACHLSRSMSASEANRLAKV